MKLKTKEELDLIPTYDMVMEYRTDVLRSDTPEWEEYVDELDLYVDIRFKEVAIKRFDSYREKLKNPKTEELDRQMMSLIVQSQPDNESLYNFFVGAKIKILKPYKYINM